MRKFFIQHIIMLITLNGCSQKENSMFLNKILNNFSRNSYFVLINVISSNDTSLCLIENDDLFFYFHQTKGFKEEEYKKSMTSFFNDNQLLELKSDEIKKYGFITVTQIVGINEASKKGKDFFLNKYFKNHLLKDGITNDDKYYIIKVLYDWDIAARIDDETGYLIIDK